MSNKEKFIGEAQMQELPQKPLKLKLGPKVVKLENLADEVINRPIADGSVTTSKIADGAVTSSKLASDILTPLETRVESLEEKVGDETVDESIQNALAPVIITINNNKQETDTRIDNEVLRATNAETQISSSVNTIEEKIPNAASSLNQLADKAFVNSSIATNTANYISNGGEPFNSYAELLAYQGPKSNNDYAFVKTTDAVGNTVYKRYKYTTASNTWALEYELNNSSFTASQWEAINSGITALLTGKLNALPTYAELIAMFAGKQDVVSDLAAIRSGATAGSTAYQKPSSGIPETDLNSEVRTKVNAAYQKPNTGIPKSDLSVDVQTSLGKADTAIQSLTDYYNKAQVDTLLNGKQDTLTIDSTPTINSGNPISSDAVYDLQQATVTALNEKQAKLTFDNMPTAGSANPVTSGGIYTAIVNSSGITFIEVDVLPAPSVSTVGAVYVLKQDDNIFEWYVTIYDQFATPPEYKWRLVNTNSIDLSEFYTRTECDYTFAKKSEMSVTPGTGVNVDKTTIQLKNDLNATVLVQHQDISGKADKSEMSITPGTGDDADKTTIQLKDNLSTTVLIQHQDISGKQDVLTFATDAECEAAANELT